MPLPFVLALIVLAAGGPALGLWLARRLRPGAASPEASRVEAELRARLGAQDAELAAAREALSRSRESEAGARAEAEARERSLEELKSRHERDLAERRASLEHEVAALKEAFKALSADALRAVQPEVLGRVKELVASMQGEQRGDLEKRQQAIQGLVGPLAEQLKAYAERLQQSEKDQHQALGAVRAQLEGLSRSSTALTEETERFRRVLHSNQARGRWGEETLRNVVEAAGLSPHCDFSVQPSEDAGRPDMVVRLPGERAIVVDAKAPDLGFAQRLDAGGAEDRGGLLKAHVASVRDRVKELSERGYASKVPGSLEYVVLFLPAESLFSLALEGDKDLLLWAASRGVILATPASLIALLKAVSLCWTQASQMDNAREINRLARELSGRVDAFLRHFDGIQKGLSAAARAYNEAVGSYAARVLPAGRALARLQGGADDGDAFREREALEFTPRPLPLPGDAGAGGG